MDNSFKLVYVLGLGENWEGVYTYEFLFTDEDNLDNILNYSEDWAWDVIPASGNPSRPDREFIKAVGRIQTTKPFELIQDSDTFCVWDGLDNVTSIAWEDISEYDEYPEYRLFFRYAETAEEVKKKLYKVDINIDYDEVK